jgi:hypothetical protein
MIPPTFSAVILADLMAQSVVPKAMNVLAVRPRECSGVDAY